MLQQLRCIGVAKASLLPTTVAGAGGPAAKPEPEPEPEPESEPVGHPVVAAGRDAEQIFVQVTKLHLAAGKFMFHVALNNPLERSVDVDVWPSFPDVRLVRQHVTLGPGEHRVLV